MISYVLLTWFIGKETFFSSTDPNSDKGQFFESREASRPLQILERDWYPNDAPRKFI